MAFYNCKSECILIKTLPMKQFHTLEDELIMLAKSVSLSATAGKEAPLPGKSVIRNILNYSRSMQVLKKSNGACLFLINN